MSDLMKPDVGMPLMASPSEIIAQAKEMAGAMMDVVESQKLYQPIRGKKFLCVEGWQLLASFSGLTPVITECRPIEIGEVRGWEAVCEVRDRQGNIVAAASAICCDDEPNWRNKPQYQLRSMAQTRAVSKAIRTKLSFVAVLAGYEPTPAEEVTEEVIHQPTETKPTKQVQPETSDERNKAIRRFFAVAKEAGLLADEELKDAVAAFLKDTYKVESRSDMSLEQWEEATELIGQPAVQKTIKELADEIRKVKHTSAAAEGEEPLPF